MSLAELFFLKHPRKVERSGRRAARRLARPRSRPGFLLEPLEQRVLLSANLIPALSLDAALIVDAGVLALGPSSDGASDTGATATVTGVLTAASEAVPSAVASSTGAAQIVFIDPAVGQADTLIQAFRETAGAGAPVEVIVLDDSRDGIAQVTALLAGRRDVGAVHVLSHGDAGHLALGATMVDAAVLE